MVKSAVYLCAKKYSWNSCDSCSKPTIRTVNSCSKKESVFICVYPCAKNIRDIRAIRVQRKNPCSSVCQKHSLFEKFVFKKIRVYLCLSVCQKYSIRVQRKFVFKKAVHPSPTHQCRTQTDHLYLICHARRLPSPSPDTTITITSSHHFTTFLRFTIYIPWGKLLIPAPVAIRLPSRV